MDEGLQISTLTEQYRAALFDNARFNLRFRFRFRLLQNQNDIRNDGNLKKTMPKMKTNSKLVTTSQIQTS